MPSGPNKDMRLAPGPTSPPQARVIGTLRSSSNEPAEVGWAEYRRRARRLRCRLAARPAQLQWALGDLARRQDSQRGPGQPMPRRFATVVTGQQVVIGEPAHHPDEDFGLGSVLGVGPASAQRLGRLIEDSLSDGWLPYARRQDVLRAARRLGVGRFQANLVIAAVQHRHAAPAGGAEPPRAVEGFGGWGLVAAVAALVEAGILLGAWWLVRA